MGEIILYYFYFLLIMQPIEEVHNCNNPNLIESNTINLVCVWNDQDFYKSITGHEILRPKRKKDNIIKAYYRGKYWNAKQKSKG